MVERESKKVFRPSDGFSNKCGVCAAILKLYLSLGKDVVCWACNRQFYAPQALGRTFKIKKSA